MTSPRRRSQKSTSMSGIEMRSGFRKRSNRRSKSTGSTSAIFMHQAATDAAADPRPGRNACFPRVPDEVPHDQQVPLEPGLPDDLQLVIETPLVLVDRVLQTA